MDENREQPSFEIKPVIEQQPFESQPVQSFFTKWCDINDSIKPEYVDRKTWEKQRETGLLKKTGGGKKTLYIPFDLQLWEMIDVMRVVDRDTYASTPGRSEKSAQKVRDVGVTIRNAGIYIAQRLDAVPNGQNIARNLAQDFYAYGKSLVEGKKGELESIDTISSYPLTPEELEAVDRFLAGDQLYSARKAKVDRTAQTPEQKDELYETQRRETLAQFFRTAQKAFDLRQKTQRNHRTISSESKPWVDHTPLHNALLARLEKRMARAIETPRREFEMAIFRRGLQKLVTDMREPSARPKINTFLNKLGIDISVEKRKLADALEIDSLKAELISVRQTGDLAQISAKELDITDKIQHAVSRFPYVSLANNPSEMVANRYINCVGASILGGALMKEVGLNYLVGNIPKHSSIFLVTADGRVYWRDMLSRRFPDELTDELIESQNTGGPHNMVADIAEFSKRPSSVGLGFRLKDGHQFNIEGETHYITLYGPEHGQMIQLLNNTGKVLSDLNMNREAVEAYQQAINEEPLYSYPHYGLGNVLTDLRRYDEAVSAYRRAIAIDPDFKVAYNRLGNALRRQGRDQEAIEVYHEVLKIYPSYAYAYHGLGMMFEKLGRVDEAIAAYQSFVDLADKKKDRNSIEEAENVIKKLKKSNQNTSLH